MVPSAAYFRSRSWLCTLLCRKVRILSANGNIPDRNGSVAFIKNAIAGYPHMSILLHHAGLQPWHFKNWPSFIDYNTSTSKGHKNIITIPWSPSIRKNRHQGTMQELCVYLHVVLCVISQWDVIHDFALGNTSMVPGSRNVGQIHAVLFG
jgi:hypothetical protein